MEERLSKHTILRKDKLIQLLFSEGSSIRISGIQVRWLHTSLELPVDGQVLFSVPKRLFRKATERNLIKRRMREAFRGHKFLLLNSLRAHHLQGIYAFIYTKPEILPSKEIREKIIVLLQRLKIENEKASG